MHILTSKLIPAVLTNYHCSSTAYLNHLLCNFYCFRLNCGCKNSLFQSGSTTAIQIWLDTASSTPKPDLKGESFPMSSWTDWSGSSPSRIWKSGRSTRSEFRPSTGLALDRGVSQSIAGQGSLVRTEISSDGSVKLHRCDDVFTMPAFTFCCSALQRPHQRVSVCHHVQQHLGAVGRSPRDRSQRTHIGL